MSEQHIKTIYNCEITTLSPLFIGSGEEINQTEYYFDNMSKEVVLIDFDKLLESEKLNTNDINDLTRKIEREKDNFSIKEYMESKKIPIKDFEKHRIKCNIIGKNVIKTFIKTNGLPYIPGSSIKGAIRTAWLWYILTDFGENDKKTNIKTIEELFRIMLNDDKRFADDNIMSELFGKNPNYDIFKILQITDTNATSFEKLKIFKTEVISLKNKKSSIPVYIEGLPTNSNAENKITIDEFLLKGKNKLGENEKIPQQLEFSDKELIGTKDDIIEACNSFYEVLIEQEIEFYSKYRMENLVDFYKNLNSKISDNECLLRIGQGSSWLGMTIGVLLRDNPEILMKIRKEYGLGRRRAFPEYLEDYPITRRLAYEDNLILPLGWLKIKMEEVKK